MNSKYTSLINKLKKDCSLIKNLDYDYRVDYNFLKECECLKDCPNYHEILNAKYKVIFGAYPTTPSFYELSETDRDDELIVRPFILRHPFYLLDVSDRLQNDKSFIKSIICINKDVIRYINHIFHDDIDIMEEALNRYGSHAYQFASDRLKNDPDFIILISNNKKIYREFCRETLKSIENTFNILKSYIYKHNKLYSQFNFSKMNKGFIMKFFEICKLEKHLRRFICNLYSINKSWLKDLEIIESAYKINKKMLFLADDSVLGNDEFLNKLDIPNQWRLGIKNRLKKAKEGTLKKHRIKYPKRFLVNRNLENKNHIDFEEYNHNEDFDDYDFDDDDFDLEDDFLGKKK